MGYHRVTFQKVLRAIQMGGTIACVHQRLESRQQHSNRDLQKVEDQYIAFCLKPGVEPRLTIVDLLYLLPPRTEPRLTCSPEMPSL
jgi:hypothetical protein